MVLCGSRPSPWRWAPAAATGPPGRSRAPVPARVTVVAARRMTLPIVVNPIGTTRALEDVTIRARVKGFLKEKHFEEAATSRRASSCW